MNEWGIPDWRDPSSYGDVERWKTDRWRWEFRRRRDDLREFFDCGVKDRESLPFGHSPSFLDPTQAGFLLATDAASARRFGYVHGIPNPRISEQPDWAIKTYAAFESDPGIYSWDDASLGVHLDLSSQEETVGRLIHSAWASGLTSQEARDLLDAANLEEKDNGLSSRLLGHLMQCKAVYLRTGEVAVTFNLDEPLADQLKAIQRVLKKRQIERHGNALQIRTYNKNWFLYLRTLDARDAIPRPPWRDIAIALLPTRKDEADETTHARETKARDTWKQANNLRFNF